MKGIVLAGGSGTRLYPITKGVSKQMLPIYDKPMIYYPISVLMLAGIRDILIISTPQDLPGFKRLLGDGDDYGVRFSYAEQPSPDGLAQAFIIGEEFIGDDCACLVLGDNIFHGTGFVSLLRQAVADAEQNSKATVFGYWVADPQRYGVAEFAITKGVSKQMLPIYDKPMIYYPISVLMLAGIRDILIISTPQDLPGFKRLLGDGDDYGVRFSYAEQPSPDGLAQAFIIGEEFIGDDCACLVLGDNIFHGTGFVSLLRQAVADAEQNSKATVFGYWVADPQRYGVAEFDDNGNCLSIEEKPQNPKSNYAVVGLYFYPNKVVDIAKSIKPSARGELEITTVNQEFLGMGELKVQTLGRGFAWLDTGTHDSLSEASTFIEVIEKRQGLKVACLEGIAYRMGWITADKLRELAKPMAKNQYGQYLLRIADELPMRTRPIQK